MPTDTDIGVMMPLSMEEVEVLHAVLRFFRDTVLYSGDDVSQEDLEILRPIVDAMIAKFQPPMEPGADTEVLKNETD